MLTKQEQMLRDLLSSPPKCMHNPEFIIEKEDHYKCGECGLVAKKNTIVLDYFKRINEK